jgi:hypothetical protein
LQTVKTNGGGDGQSHRYPYSGGTEAPEVDQGRSRRDPAITIKAGSKIHEDPSDVVDGLATRRTVVEAENLGAKQVLSGQAGLPVGVDQAAVTVGRENPSQAVQSDPQPQRLVTSIPAAVPAPIDRSATTSPLPPSDKSSATLGEAVAISAAAVKPYVPVPPYPLRAITAQILNGRGQAGDREMTAEKDHGDATALTAEPRKDAHAEGLAQRGKNASHPVKLAVFSMPTRRSQISGGYSIDKSVLAIPSERRLRSKAHLVMVASHPCVVCEEMPCHAHHVTFAQPRGLSLKVSDEFTVPLCVKHHNEVHAKGHEASWWRGQGIDPLVHARQLWLITAGLLSDPHEAPIGGPPANARNVTTVSDESHAMDNGAVLAAVGGSSRDECPGASSNRAPNSEIEPGNCHEVE